MATKFIETSDATFGAELWESGSGTRPTIVSDIVRAGHQRSIKPGINVAGSLEKQSVFQQAGNRISFWFYINAIAAGATRLTIDCANSLNLQVCGISFRTDGGYEIDGNTTGTAAVVGTTIPSTGTWHHGCFAYTITNSTTNEFRFWLDGALDATATNFSMGARVVPLHLFAGIAVADTALDIRFSEFYIDDDTSLTFPGLIGVTAKRPNANGTTNGFSTQVGAGGSGYGTGHSPQVNERALSVTNGWSMIGAGAAITEEYNIENAATGDIDLTGAPVIDFTGWVYAKSLTSETASIIVAGATSNISLTSTTTMFVKVAGSTTYPPGSGADIGIITSTTLTTVSLFECGIMIAYTAATSAATTQRRSLLGVGF